jgi:hypothetical protein
MTKRLPCPPAPGPLEGYAAQFDDRLGTLAQRRGFREYLQGLLLPRDRHKTLTGLVGTEPVVGAQDASAQRLQFFLSESPWDVEAVNDRRLELVVADPATAPHDGGVLVIDDSGDRKDGKATAHVGRQWLGRLGRLGKTDNGVVTVTTLWADERLYYPLHAVPYTPARHFPKGRNDPGFATKLQIAAQLARQAEEAGVCFRAVAADCAYAAREPAWHGPGRPGDWTAVTRTFRDGHTATWWAAEARLGWWGPDGTTRLVVATTDPNTLPDESTWYLATNLPRPGSPHAPAAFLVRC